jgi:oligosaccharide repeat unit polymerase
VIFFWGFIFLYLAILIIGINHFRESEGLISTFSIFGITGFFYYLAVPIECVITGNDFIALGDNVVNPLLDTTKIAISFMSVLALCGFYFGLKISKFSYIVKSNYLLYRRGVAPNGILFLILISFVILISLFRDKIVLSGTYEGNVDTSYNNPLYTLLVDWIVLGCSIICGAIIIKKKRVNYLSFLFSIPGLYWGVYASTKDQLLIAVLGLLTYFTVANPIKNFFLLIIGFIFLILLAPLGLLWFSLYRSGVIINMEALYAVLEKGVIRNTDPAGPIAVFNDLFNSGVDMKFGSTYLDTFYLLVPKFVWANRPLDVAEKYAQETLKYWLPGQGLGYSLLIEGYINFSYFGVFIQYFTTGLLWGITWNLVKKIVLNISVYIWLSLYSIFGFFLIIIIHRSPFSGTPKQMFLTLPIILFVLFLFNKKKINEE